MPSLRTALLTPAREPGSQLAVGTNSSTRCGGEGPPVGPLVYVPSAGPENQVLKCSAGPPAVTRAEPECERFGGCWTPWAAVLVGAEACSRGLTSEAVGWQ